MGTGSRTHLTAQGTDPDALVRLGGWLFKQRSWLPVPIVLALVLIPVGRRSVPALWSGVVLVAAGEALRLWAVHHIGVISRTRSDRLGPLISTGPFGHVRNPLYLGNIALWLGFTISGGLLWLVPTVLGVLALEYHAIVRWEEGLLSARMGAPYRRYLAVVPRWIPSWRRTVDLDSDTRLAPGQTATYSWRDTVLSERSTLVAVALGYFLLWVKG